MTSGDRIREFIAADIVKNKDIDLGTDRPLVADGLLNSIGIMKLIDFMSREFGIKFEDDDYSLENFETMQAILQLLERRQPATA